MRFALAVSSARPVCASRENADFTVIFNREMHSATEGESTVADNLRLSGPPAELFARQETRKKGEETILVTLPIHAFSCNLVTALLRCTRCISECIMHRVARVLALHSLRSHACRESRLKTQEELLPA